MPVISAPATIAPVLRVLAQRINKAKTTMRTGNERPINRLAVADQPHLI
jgi:hypothetical protein